MSHFMKFKKAIICVLTAAVLLATQFTSAFACTMIYVGSDLTEDGETFYARSEDISNSYNKVFYVSPAGNHTEGEEYTGCYGFKYTFTHDSYSYTAVRDDNLSGKCPDCGGTHDHTAYEEVGTNEKGVSITATVTLGGNKAIKKVDPMDPKSGDDIYGIEEAEITTVLLSEASTAKEALEILMNIYDTVGADGGSGIIISDANEAWYIENCTGTQYIALKLNPELLFISPNQSAIGLIDLDDENVIASAKLIETAQTAGTFVGDAEANIIDYNKSYSSSTTPNARLVNGANYLDSAKGYTSETLTADIYSITNVKDDAIVPFYTGLTVSGPVDIQTMVDFYKVDGIGNTSNLEYHIFQLADGSQQATDTVMWMGFDHGAYGVMVPYYSMLTEYTYDAYQVGTAKKSFSATQPESGAYYSGSNRGTQGYFVLPENWADSYYWSFDAVSNYVASGMANADEKQLVIDTYAALQAKIYDSFEALQAIMPEMYALNPELAADYASQYSANMAEAAHKTAVALYNTIANDEELVLPEYVDLPWFTDVKANAWCIEDVLFVAKQGLFCGYKDGSFKPNEEMTRAMFTAVLYRLAVSPDVSALAEVTFKDVDANAYYADAVKWAVANGVVYGYNEDCFAPDESISREQLITMLYRYESPKTPNLDATLFNSYADSAEVSACAVEAMTWGVNYGVIYGTSDTTLSPDGVATRAQVACFLTRLITNLAIDE